VIRVEANRSSINYESSGSGRCFTLVHGSSDNLNEWHNQVTVFSQCYQVLTYDIREYSQMELSEGELPKVLVPLVEDKQHREEQISLN